MQPTYRQIEYFRTVAETHSFSAAAKQCNVTQSTLSAGVRDLENTLGVQLFVRTSREVHLTPEGQVLYQQSQKMFDDMEDFVETAQRFGEAGGGVLRIGMIPTIAPYILSGLYDDMKAANPEMHIHLHEDISAELINKLNAKLIDIAIMAFPYPVGSYGHEVICHDPLQLIAHKDIEIPLKKGCVSVYDLQDVPMIMLSDGHCLRDHALASCSLGERSVLPNYQAVTMPSLIEMVCSGLGATLVSKLMLSGGKYNLPDDVNVYDFATPVPERQIGIVWQRTEVKAHAMHLKKALHI